MRKELLVGTLIIATTVITAIILMDADLTAMDSPLVPLPENNNVGIAWENGISPISMITTAVAVSVIAAGTVHYGLFTGSGPPNLSSVKTVSCFGAGSERRNARMFTTKLESLYIRNHKSLFNSHVT